MRLLKNKVFVLLSFLFLSLPLIVGTFDTVNWSDDFNRPVLWGFKATFSPFWVMILSPSGQHFLPVTNLFYYLITSLTLDPRSFHLVITLCYITTAFFVFLLVQRYYKDDLSAVLAGGLFAVNYYIGFKALTWNTFHAHCTNTMTGVISLYCLICYLQDKKKRCLFGSCVALFFTIFNTETGFLFFIALIVFVLFSFFKKHIQTKKAAQLILVFSFVMALYPAWTYLRMGEPFPLSHRFESPRNVQNYLFNIQQLLVQSTGLTVFYNELFFDPLRTKPELKEPIVRLVKENDNSALRDIPFKYILFFGFAGLLALASFIFIGRMALTNGLREETWPFAVSYLLLFISYIFVYYRVDITNALGVFSSVIMADFIASFLRSRQKVSKNTGIALISLFVIAASWTIIDQFEDCYQKSYTGITRATIKGPHQIYDEINRKIGHYIDQGLLLFTHDYSPYHRTIGFERIGDMIGMGDLICYNAVVFGKEFLKTSIPEEYRNKTTMEFEEKLVGNPNNKIMVVNSEEDAINYLKVNQVDLEKLDAVYMTKDYKIIYLNERLGSGRAPRLLRDKG